MSRVCTLCVVLTGKCCFYGIALIFVSLLVLNLLTGAGVINFWNPVRMGLYYQYFGSPS